MAAVAFEHFRTVGCDIVVLEVGLGGRGHIRAHRPLPVGTRHVHEAQLVLGAPQALQQIHHAREPQARGLPARGVYPGYGIEVARIFHGTFSFKDAATVFLQTR